MPKVVQPNTPFPGTQAELDILTTVARIRQLRDNKMNQDYAIYLLITNDLPRLETYLSQKVKDWSGLFGTE